MNDEVRQFREVLQREMERIEARSADLGQRFRKLRASYPSARSLGEPLDKIRREDARFLEYLRSVDWKGQMESLEDSLKLYQEARSNPRRIVLDWDQQRMSFVSAGQLGSRQRHRRGDEAILEPGHWMEKYAAQWSGDGVNETGVSYPIIFTHEVESNHRAVAASLCWALAVAALRRASRHRDRKFAVRLRGEGMELEFFSTAPPAPEEIPGAENFGFRSRGRFWRRLQEFAQTDPAAHLRRWLESRKQEQPQRWVLREHRGAILRVEVQPALRRVRLVDKPRSQVVRKRKAIFVDEEVEVTEDRYFADLVRLEEGLQELMRRRIEAGFRLIARPGQGGQGEI